MKYQTVFKYYYNKVKSSLEPELEILEYLVKKNDLVIDVGGNRGVYAYKLWKLSARVEVFEPNPVCSRLLNAWASDKPNVNIHSVGLSNSTGTANLHIPVDDNGVEHDASASIESTGIEQSRDQLVTLKTLDSYQFNDVSFIKIDVEGHEYSMLEGAEALLLSSRPALLVEIEQRHNSRAIDEVFEMILNFGYQGFFMLRGQMIALEEFDVVQHQSLDNFGGPREQYINNFLFFHRDRLEAGEYSDLFDGRKLQ